MAKKIEYSPNPVGRPTIAETKMISRPVCMTAAQWAAMKKLGDGSYSAGARAAIDAIVAVSKGL